MSDHAADADRLASIGALIRLMRRLRDPKDGCPWDAAQTFASISAYTIEEAYEVADAIEREAWDELADELGDLLLQVVFHAQIADELGLFDLKDVAEAINRKLIRRHPHLFGVDAGQLDATVQRATWETIKASERQARAEGQGRVASVLDGVARTLPPLQRARKLQERAAREGFDWPETAQVWDKVHEELAEVEEAIAQPDGRSAQEDEIGDLLFTIVNLARHLQIDAEAALRRTNAKFERRFKSVEAQAGRFGKEVRDLPLETLDAYWRQAKVEEKSRTPGS